MKIERRGKKVKLKGQKVKMQNLYNKKHIHTPKGHIFKEKNLINILVIIKKTRFFETEV